ncbi:hypothetical protein ACNPPY_01010 [Achromobacter sp. AGC78]
MRPHQEVSPRSKPRRKASLSIARCKGFRAAGLAGGGGGGCARAFPHYGKVDHE